MKRYLLDTNVVSEVRRKLPNEKVVEWIAVQNTETLYLSVVTLGEICQGIERLRLHDESQAEGIEKWFTELAPSFAGRVLVVNAEIAERWGRLCPRQTLGAADGLIAATAIEHGMTLVTRNVQDFERTGVSLLNPFEENAAHG